MPETSTMLSVPAGPFAQLPPAHGTGHQAAVIPPVEADPRSVLPGLVLDVSGLVKLFVVVDAEHLVDARRRADSTNLRGEETRRHAGHDDERRQAVEVRHAAADGITRN